MGFQSLVGRLETAGGFGCVGVADLFQSLVGRLETMGVEDDD